MSEKSNARKAKETTEIANVDSNEEKTLAENAKGNNKSHKKLILIISASIVTIAVIVGIILFFILTAKSEEAIRVDNIINEIGTVTLESEDKIINAEKEVEALAEEDYKQLDNLEMLKTARNTYTDLVNQDEIDTVIRFINDIGEVTINSDSKINAAQNSYDNLQEDLKSKVTNYKVLEESKNKYNQLKANEVVALINSIGKVTVKSKDTIEKAEKAFNALTIAQQKYITNYQTLIDAREALKKAQEKSKQEALSKLSSHKDGVSGWTYYEATTKPEYINSRSYVLPYIGVSPEGTTALFLEADYVGEDWIFYDELYINADGKTYTRDFEFSIDRDNENGLVWEYYNQPAKNTDITWLRAIANSNNAVVRFSGDLYNYDMTISNGDKKAIGYILDAYELIE